MVDLLPPVMAEDDFTRRFVSIFDQVQATVVERIDAAGRYFDPTLAPVEFVRALGGWLNLHVPAAWDDEQARRFVVDVVPLIQWRGTRRWIEAFLGSSTGCDVNVDDPHGVGGVGDLVASDGAPVVVRILGERAWLTRREIESIVRDEMPAGVPYELRFELAGEPLAGATSVRL
jgi:phage tail-like protein